MLEPKGYPKYSELVGKVEYKVNGTTLDTRHFPYLHGEAKTVESLSGKWCPDMSLWPKHNKYMQ